MTSALLAPCRRGNVSPRLDARDVPGSCDATAILDWHSAEVAAFAEQIGVDARDERAFLTAAHARIASSIRPVYALDDTQPTSRTLRLGRGSCSQRLAVLESVARRSGIPTRVRGVAVDGSFWYPRFPRLTWLVPDQVILAWPQFRLSKGWLDTGELFGTLGALAACGVGFANRGGETLFDAIRRTAVDWDGSAGRSECDLSAVVREDLGYFDSRDALFHAHGQTLSRVAVALGDPVMRRRAAGGG